MSDRLATNVVGLPTGPISWLPFRVKKLVSFPATHVKESEFDLTLIGPTVVKATTVSVPGSKAL